MDKRIKRENCTVIYEEHDNRIKIKRCIPDNGISVFEIQATYEKSVPASKYYFFSTTTREAKERFIKIFPWINIITSVKEVTGKDELEEILTDPIRIPN